MRFTFIALRILPLTLSLHSMPLDPLVPKLTMRLSAGAQIPMTQKLTCINYLIVCHIQPATWNNKILFWQSLLLKY